MLFLGIRGVGENALSQVEQRRNLLRKFLTKRSYENKRKARKVEKTVKFELIYETEEKGDKHNQEYDLLVE